ncbi:hypothetical protein V1460_23275 [Streptomyces sp. SCSIO 30461]
MSRSRAEQLDDASRVAPRAVCAQRADQVAVGTRLRHQPGPVHQAEPQ